MMQVTPVRSMIFQQFFPDPNALVVIGGWKKLPFNKILQFIAGDAG